MVDSVNIIEELKSLNSIKMATLEGMFSIFDFSITSIHRTDCISKTMSKFMFV